MTERGGHSIRGSLRHPNTMVNTMYPLDSPRRGRGRPRKFPLTTPIVMPEEEVLSGQDEVEEGVYEDEDGQYYNSEAGGEQVVDNDQEDEEKIKNIQQDKMMIITPMGCLKRAGKPQRGYTKSGEKTEEYEGNGEGTSQDGGQVEEHGDVNIQEDRIEPLLPKEAHIEEANVVEQEEGEKETQPPPPPKNLLNRISSRGRPPLVPPHRRPIPKDLVPPGMPRDVATKRMNAVKDAARKQKEKGEDDARGGEDAEKQPDESEKSNDAPESSTKKEEQARGIKKREAGQDLPFEHMPKQKARHVARAGIIPNVSYESMKAYDMPMVEDEEVLMHEAIIEDGETSGEPQQMIALQEEEEYIDREDAQQKEMMNPNTRYIEVEENGVNVVYEVQEDEVNGEIVGEVVEENQPETEYVIEEQHDTKNEDGMLVDDDDLPPQLVPEEVQDDEAIRAHRRQQSQDDDDHEGGDQKKGEEEVMNFDMSMMEPGQTFRLSSPGGRTHDVQLARDEDGNAVFIDENGVIVELITDNGQLVEPSGVLETGVAEQQDDGRDQEGQEAGDEQQQQQHQQQNVTDHRNIEFNFLDSRNICCGLCGEIVLYETLVSEHLPNAHPEFLQPGVELEEVPYENWLKSRLRQEAKTMQNSFRHYDEHVQEQAQAQANSGAVRLFSRGLRQLRKVSQIRVNPNEMTMDQLEVALQRKMFEKLGRKVPVSLVDRLHARCDICQAVVSLNKKFEVVHLVRHFNAWHPSEHRCSNSWKQPNPDDGPGQIKSLSLHDFAVVDCDGEQNNLQCIWCGMFMDRAAIGMHFSEVHRDQVEVPKCSLCLQEMVMSARLLEKYGEDFGISLPDEFHVESSRLQTKHSSEKALDNAIEKYLKRLRNGQSAVVEDDEDLEDDKEAICTTNSQQSFGRRNRLKRKFVKPCFRQICPTNSQYFEAFSACEWKCKLCGRNVYGAVISAGAIKHYKEFHPAEMENMQYELVKARLERIGDGSMEFVHPQLVECLICNMTYSLHKPFNICRAIRHLRLKHAEVMPETMGKPISGAEIQETTSSVDRSSKNKKKIRIGEIITDPVILERFRRYHDVDFDKVQVFYGARPNNEPSHVLLMEGESLDQKTAEAIADSIIAAEGGVSNPLKRSPSEQSILYADAIRSSSAVNEPFDPNVPSSSSASQPNNSEQFTHQMVTGVDEERKPNLMQFMQDYSGENGEMISMDGNVIIPQDNYEMMQEDGQYSGQDSRVQYMTEEELREAEARGDIQIEYVDSNDINFDEYNDGGQQHAV